MALTHLGCALKLRLPRWDHHLVERLEHAGIQVPDAPEESFVGHPLEVTVAVPVESADAARDHVIAALRGWTVLLPMDFAATA
jgi:hypothetical protein